MPDFIEVRRLQVQVKGQPTVDRKIHYSTRELDAAERRMLGRRVVFLVADEHEAESHFVALHAKAKEFAARGELAKFLDMLDRRDDAPKAGRRFADFAQEWLDTCVIGSDLKSSQVESDKSILTHHLLPAFGTRYLAEIDARAVDQFKAKKLKEKHVKGKGYAPASVNNMLSVLHRMMEKAIEWKEAAANPVTGRWVRDGAAATERSW